MPLVTLRGARLFAQAAVPGLGSFYAAHRSDYLSDDTKKRELPAKYIKAFEATAGNTAISQWIARGARLTVLEEMQARAAA